MEEFYILKIKKKKLKQASVFYYIYWIISLIIYIVAIPFLLIFALKKKYRSSIPARFFLYKNRPLENGDIHFHVCSLGEAISIKPIISKFNKYKLAFSAITHTGFGVISNYSTNSRYLPFELFLPFWIKKQKVLLVFEAELWYMLFATYFKRGTKTFLINARISDNSYHKYLKFRWFYARVFRNICKVYAQSETDKKRLIELGAKDVEVIGNIKFCNITKQTKCFERNRDLIISAASTHEGEEELILKAFIELKKSKKAQLIVVPRHPERFEKVALLLEKEALQNGLSFSRYSKSRAMDTDVVLIDAMGELINVYAISDIAIMGGTFAPIGGHNVLEAAQFGVKIVSGLEFFNQKAMYKAVDGINIVDAKDLIKTLLNYENLTKSSIDTNVSIERLIEDIKETLGR